MIWEWNVLVIKILSHIISNIYSQLLLWTNKDNINNWEKMSQKTWILVPDLPSYELGGKKKEI